jgi:Amt family ammonium transporter
MPKHKPIRQNKLKAQDTRIRLLPKKWQYYLASTVIIALLLGVNALANAKQGYDHTINPQVDNTPIKVVLDTTWVLLAAYLVFFMNAGFAMLEAGFCRHKNTLNILSKNLIVFVLASLAFWLTGFALMFGDGNDFLGWNGWFLRGDDNSPSTFENYQGVYRSLNWAGVTLKAKFFFQLVFAGIAATIVSGAVAERIKFLAFIIFSLFVVGIIYPISGHWIWGGGWLQKLGFYDFAGSTVVHSLGGWCALVGVIILGARLDKYQNDKSYTILGHNYALSTLGCFILWLGWFGFNAGSTMEADAARISHIVLTTNTAIIFGAMAAVVTYWCYYRVSDLTMIINGVLGGAVSITASCQYVGIESAAIIGAIAGIVVVLGVDWLDQLKIDDPVGAIPAHLFCGIWGTIAVGLFSEGGGIIDSKGLLEAGKLYAINDGPVRGLFLGNLAAFNQVGIQLLGIIVVGAFTIFCSWLIWSVIKNIWGIRVTPDMEQQGLDLSQHGFKAYGGFTFKDEE